MEEFRIKFRGVRGSYPVPSADFFIVFFAQNFLVQIQLDFSGVVSQVHKCSFTHNTFGHNTTCNGNGLFFHFFEVFQNFSRECGAVELGYVTEDNKVINTSVVSTDDKKADKIKNKINAKITLSKIYVVRYKAFLMPNL